MNYLRSMEYLVDKANLQGEFKEAFLTIEGYYTQVYTEQSYEVQLALKQILKDFLMEQEAERPLTAVTGPDIKDYALDFIESKYDSKKRPLYLITTAVIMVWLCLFLMFVRTLSTGEHIDYTFIEKMRHMYFGLDLLIVIGLAYLSDYIKKSITSRFFNRLGIIKTLNLLFSLFLALLVIIYINNSSSFANILRFRIPLFLFLVLALITSIYMISAGLISYMRTRAKKRDLITHEVITIEQVDCPSCGHRHDIDYPKCPSCGLLNK
jgi:DNA-binding ferritin-like protein (Dps family)